MEAEPTSSTLRPRPSLSAAGGRPAASSRGASRSRTLTSPESAQWCASVMPSAAASFAVSITARDRSPCCSISRSTAGCRAAAAQNSSAVGVPAAVSPSDPEQSRCALSASGPARSALLSVVSRARDCVASGDNSQPSWEILQIAELGAARNAAASASPPVVSLFPSSTSSRIAAMTFADLIFSDISIISTGPRSCPERSQLSAPVRQTRVDFGPITMVSIPGLMTACPMAAAPSLPILFF